MLKIDTATLVKLFGKKVAEELSDAKFNMPKNKYRNKRCECDGIKFASRREMFRYGELKLRLLAGEIKDLELQPVYEFPQILTATGKPTKYKADFRYMELTKNPEGELVVEDCKGFRTQEYLRKKKWMQVFHGIEIREVF